MKIIQQKIRIPTPTNNKTVMIEPEPPELPVAKYCFCIKLAVKDVVLEGFTA